MSDQKSSKEIQAEIDALTEQLAATLRREIADLTRQAEEGEAKYQALLRKMDGRRIWITLKNDSLCGIEAIILKPHGKSKKPMYWWFRTTTGIETYKAMSAGQLCDLRRRPLHVASRTAIYGFSTIVDDATELG